MTHTKPPATAQGRCRTCDHWRTTYCNGDGFYYCARHYPEQG